MLLIFTNSKVESNTMKHLNYLVFIFALCLLSVCSCKNGEPNVQTSEIKNAAVTPTKSKKSAKSASAHASTSHLNTGGMLWTTFNEMEKSGFKPNGKKYLVDVYTDWCGWCKVMDKKTFTDPDVQAYLNEHFNIVKFDAEQKESITLNGRIYEWQAGGRNGYNQLAKELLGPRMSYPTMVYLDENMKKIKSIPGYKKPDQILSELKNIVEKF